MIKNIIFDFGDIFINLDKPATEIKLQELGVKRITQSMLHTAQLYEMGLLSTEHFIAKFQELYPSISAQNFTKAWNAILLDTPNYRFDFIKELAIKDQYRLFLLSNTNDLHIKWIQGTWGMELYNEFKSCFEQFYLSHEIHFRKPNFDIYEFVLNENDLIPEETLFIDDTTENTTAAAQLGIHIWNLNPRKEDVTELFSQPFFR